VGEFLASLDRTADLDARLGLSGHGRPFSDVPGHIAANRALVAERLAAVQAALAAAPRTAYELAQAVYGELFGHATAPWLLTKTLCWLTHLERRSLVVRAGETPERWSSAA
jgi:hypothetical protein